jgi:hypothetical protein
MQGPVARIHAHGRFAVTGVTGVDTGCTISVRLGDLESRSRAFDLLQNTAG